MVLLGRFFAVHFRLRRLRHVYCWILLSSLPLVRGAALRDEYKIYHLLRKSGVTAGITTPLGLFDDVEGGVSALVMPYAGTPLAAMPEFVLTRSYQCSTFLSHFHPPFLTPCGQGSRFGEFKGNSYSRRTPWCSSFGQHTCGRFGSHNYRFRSIPSVL